MLNDEIKTSTDALHGELLEVFGPRLRSLILYGAYAWPDAAPPTDGDSAIHTLALTETVTFADLTACARLTKYWTARRLAVPLFLSVDEFMRSLDAFALEYGDIVAHHVIIAGQNPFAVATIKGEDLRRGCEIQAKSHLIHLREGFVEAQADPQAVAHLIGASARPFSTVLSNVLRLQGVSTATPDQLARFVEAGLGMPAPVVRKVVAIQKPSDLTPDEAMKLYPSYLEAAERLWQFVDGWKA